MKQKLIRYILMMGLLIGLGACDLAPGWFQDIQALNARTLLNVSNVSGGVYHSLAVTADGTLWAAGYNNRGELGDGTTNAQKDWIVTLTDVDQVVAAEEFSLALKRDGTLYVSGKNSEYQLGTGDYNQVMSWKKVFEGVKAISATSVCSFAIKEDGSLWGTGLATALGNGSNELIQWTEIPNMSDVKAVSTGFMHSAAVKEDGSLWVTGFNFAGEFGLAQTNKEIYDRIIKTNRWMLNDKISNLVDASAGYNYTLALNQEGVLFAVGDNSFWQLGVPKTEVHRTNGFMPVLSNIVKAIAGELHSLALDTNNVLWGAGYNGFGHTGAVSNTAWVAIASNVIDMGLGNGHSLMIKRDGSLWVAGYNAAGQLGTTETINRDYWSRPIMDEEYL